MDNRELIRIGLVVSGSAIGFVLGVMSTKKFYAELAQQDIDSVKQVYKARYDGLEDVERHNVVTDKVMGGDPEDITERVEAAVSTLKYQGVSAEDRVDYSGKAHLIDQKHKMSIQVMDYTLYSETYSSEDHGYDEVNLTYFESDDILVDDSEDIIVDRARRIGDDALGLLRERGDVVFVVNHDSQIVYEVDLDMRSYKEVVSGDV